MYELRRPRKHLVYRGQIREPHRQRAEAKQTDSSMRRHAGSIRFQRFQRGRGIFTADYLVSLRAFFICSRTYFHVLIGTRGIRALAEIYGRIASHLRRILETLGVERKARPIQQSIGRPLQQASREAAGMKKLGHARGAGGAGLLWHLPERRELGLVARPVDRGDGRGSDGCRAGRFPRPYRPA
jgi:hypothetical protein